MAYTDFQNAAPYNSLDSQSTNNTTSNGTAVATAGFQRAFCYARIHSSAGVGTLKVQGSNDNSTWTDITGATYTITVNSDDTEHVFDIDLRNQAGGSTGYWLRWVQIESNTGAVVTTGVIFLYKPVEQLATAAARNLTSFAAL